MPPPILAASRVDLAAVLHRLIEQEAIEPSDPDALRDLVRNYDMIVAPLCERRASSRVEVWKTGAEGRIKIRHIAMDNPDRPNLVQHALSRRDSKADRAMQAEKRVISSNNEYLYHFCQQLNSGDCRLLKDEYYREAYPHLYPLPFDAEPLLQESLELSTISKDQHVRIAPIRSSYLHLREKSVQNLIREHNSFWESFGEKFSMHGNAQVQHHQRLEAIRDQHRDTVKLVQEQLLEVLTREQTTKLRNRDLIMRGPRAYKSSC